MPDRSSHFPSPPGSDVSALVDRLSAAEIALANRLGPGADAVVDSRGHAHLLRLAQVALHESENRFRALIENSADVIALLAADATVLYESPAITQVLGYTPTELLGRRFPNLFHPDDEARAKKIFAELCATPRKAMTVGLRYRHKNGGYRWLEGTGTNLLDEPGVNAVVLNYRDVTERNDAEAARRASEQGFRSLAESMPQIVWITRPDGWNIYFNQQWVDYTGLTLEESSGHGWNTPFHPDDKQRAWEAWQDATQNDATFSVECRLRQADGVYHWWLIRGVPVRDADGKILKWFGTCTDIEAIKRAEETLAASEVRYRRLFETTKDGILILDAETGMVIDVNPFLIELLGFSHDEFLGKKIWELGFFKDIVANQANFAELLQKEYIRYEDMALETSTGRRIEVEFTSNVYRVNELKVVQCSIRDISERKAAEEKQRASDVRYRRLFETTKDGILILDAETGLVIDANPFLIELLGFSHEEFLGKKIWELGFFKDIVANQANFAELQQKEYIRYEDMALETSTGRRIEVEFTSNLYLVNHQKVIQCDIRDITVRKEAKEAIRQLNLSLEQRVRERTAELAAANQELEAFSYSVSHDLRSPLRAMDGFSLTLLKKYAGQLDEEGQNYLRRIRANSQKMAGLIEDLLNLAQLTREKMRRQRVDVTAMASTIGADLQQLNPERAVELAVAPALTTDADEGMVRVVLNNLLGNAWKFTAGRVPARIEVGAQEQDGERGFFVRDNGAGFDMTYAGKLFGAFQRLHSVQEFPGNGIGLALVQRIVNRHGGRVWAEGAVGQGATIHFTFGNKGN